MMQNSILSPNSNANFLSMFGLDPAPPESIAEDPIKSSPPQSSTSIAIDAAMSLVYQVATGSCSTQQILEMVSLRNNPLSPRMGGQFHEAFAKLDNNDHIDINAPLDLPVDIGAAPNKKKTTAADKKTKKK